MKKKLKDMGLTLVNVVLAMIYLVALMAATGVVVAVYLLASGWVLIWKSARWCWHRLVGLRAEPAR